MTKKEAIKEFQAHILPSVIQQYGEKDKPARDQAWNDWTDQLCKSGKITQDQYDTWTHPYN
jgi:hypothetical protein